jgi:hypothetical protein
LEVLIEIQEDSSCKSIFPFIWVVLIKSGTAVVRAFSHSFGLFLSNGGDALPAVGRLFEEAKGVPIRGSTHVF